MKYKKGAISTKGFGQKAVINEDRLREQSAFYVLGYGKFINWQDLEPDTLNFVQTYWDDGNNLFGQLATGNLIDALVTLRTGPWTARDLGQLLPELDTWAMVLSAERKALGEMTERTLRLLANYGIEVYHEALLKKHSESAEAEATLTKALEQVGYTLYDTGAMYSKDGEQEGPRDASYECEGAPDLICKVYHAPMRVVWKTDGEGEVSAEVKTVLKQWEGVK
jgi:hypothetical protein